MIIAKHICFYYLEERVSYINRIISETTQYNYKTNIFIHTNNISLKKEMFCKYTNGEISIIYHNLLGIDPFLLSWKCRNLMKEQKNGYDIFIYTEDDILIPKNALDYWLEYNYKLIEINYNLGFVRIEYNSNNDEFITDLPNIKLNKIIDLYNEKYCVNDINPYCAFWIYNKKEFDKFVNSEYYNINNIIGYEVRESSAIGLHGMHTPWYKNTVIPIKNGNLNKNCKVYHMPNNYINHRLFATIKFDNSIDLVT